MKTSLNALLQAQPSLAAGMAILESVRDIRPRMDRGDMAIGLLSVDEVKQTPAALRVAAQWGAKEAWLELASWLTAPPLADPDLVGAESALRKAIATDVPGAKLRLAELRWFYQRSTATEGERTEAFEILNALRVEVIADAQVLHLLGLLTCQGFGVSADPTEAFQLQRQAAALGSAAAMFELSIHYATGLGVAQNEHAALEATTQAANAGHVRAMYNLGAFFATGRYVALDLATAAQWYERASDAGHARATLTLAVMCAKGDGVAMDKARAADLFAEAEHMGMDVQVFRKSVGL